MAKYTTQKKILKEWDLRQLTDEELASPAMLALIAKGFVRKTGHVHSLTAEGKKQIVSKPKTGVLTEAWIIKGLKDGSICTYYGTFTKEHRKFLISKGYWWLKYKGVDPSIAPAGHIVATGECQMKNGKRCAGYSKHIYTSYCGEQVVPCCHSCWCNIYDD